MPLFVAAVAPEENVALVGEDMPSGSGSGSSPDPTTTVPSATVTRPLTTTAVPTTTTAAPTTTTRPSTTTIISVPSQPTGPRSGSPRVGAPAGPKTSAPPTEPEVPQDPAPALSEPALILAVPSAEPGGEIPLTGAGCVPGGPLTVYFGGNTLGTVRAGEDGTFSLRVYLPDVPVGRYDLELECGPTLSAPVDVVVATSASGGISTLALFIFFVLLAMIIFRRRRYISKRRPGPSILPAELPELPGGLGNK
jgi:hypothetical protein